MNNKMDRMWKKRWGLNLKHRLGICLEGLTKSQKYSGKIFGVPAKIRTHIPDIVQKRYHLS
jgi:hypothetical protein